MNDADDVNGSDVTIPPERYPKSGRKTSEDDEPASRHDISPPNAGGWSVWGRLYRTVGGWTILGAAAGVCALFYFVRR